MKTYIMQLEKYDDIVSVRDKMRWGKAGRILLVWPDRVGILNRRLDLVLLKRHSASLGAQLAIVSRDPEIRYHAPRLGIPVFKNLKKAQSSAWRVPRRFRSASEGVEDEPIKNFGNRTQAERLKLLSERPVRAKKPHPIIRAVAFTVGVLAFLSIAAVLLPSAEITLIPKTEIQENEINLLASPDFEQVELSGKIPAYWKTVIVEGRDSRPVSGYVRVPVTQARGEVTFTNLTDQPATIAEGTVVRTLGPEGLRFSVEKEGKIPPSLGASITLPVLSLTPGVSGNLPADSLVAIEGDLGTQLSVTNPSAIKHGADKVEPAPSKEDREDLFSELGDALKRSARRELNQSLEEGDLLYAPSLKLVEVKEEVFQPDGPQPADHLELNLRLEYQALVISGQDLADLSQMVLDANLPSGYTPEDEPLSFTHLTQPRMQNDTLSWRMKAQRSIKAQLIDSQAIQVVLGLTPDQAQKTLTNYLAIETPAEIRVYPDWWPRLPILPFRILILYSEDSTMVGSAGLEFVTP